MEWRTTYKLADGTRVDFPGGRVYQPDTLAVDEDAWLLRQRPSRQPLSFICVVNPEVFPDAEAAEADWRELQELWEPLRHAIPLFAVVRFPAKFAVLTTAVMPFAGALGWQHLIDRRTRGERAGTFLPTARPRL